LAAEVENCRLPPPPPPAAPLAANPGLGPVGAGLPAGGHVVRAPAPPSREEDEDDDDDNRIVEVTGHPLREEVFEVLEEVVDDLAGRGLNDELVALKASLIELRRVCAVRDLLAVVGALIDISTSPANLRMLIVV
jgi:hypothetical protein